MTRKRTKRITIALILIAIALIGGALYIRSQRTPAAKTDQQILKEEEAKAPKSNPKTDSEEARRQAAQTSSASASSGKATVNPLITTLEQDDSTVILDATVGTVSSGTCTATFTHAGSQNVVKTQPIERVTSYYACHEFDIPATDFPAAGQWQATVHLDSASAAGTSETKSVMVSR